MIDHKGRVRVRVAPSPTGDPHVGTAYVTLFNYVFAKQSDGDLILRLEDTDQGRARESSETQIYESLRWLGLQWDEGPDVGGAYGPYRQSERRSIHQQHAQTLVDGSYAYRCFCTPERLADLRARQRLAGETTRYDGHCRELSAERVKALQDEGRSHVVRLKVPQDGVTRFKDVIRGDIEIQNAQLDDQVLIKSDGFPTYHLANVVDDYLMKISHVIRAEEWISSTPKHVLLYSAFGWKMPQFVHLPLLRNPDKSKISKRKNPVSLNYYRRKGILPQAMTNFLALMGWSYGDDREIFTPREMMQRFSLGDMHLGGPVFDIRKLCHINQHYMKKLDASAFASHLLSEVFTADTLMKIHPLLKDRLDCFEQFVNKANFFFNGELNYEGVQLLPKGKDHQEVLSMLKQLLQVIDDVDPWQAANIEERLNTLRTELGWKPRDFFMLIRLIVTGRKDSPPLAPSLELVGKEMVRLRVRCASQSSALRGSPTSEKKK